MNTARVTHADILATNGVVHVIDAVLVPPFLKERVLTLILKENPLQTAAPSIAPTGCWDDNDGINELTRGNKADCFAAAEGIMGGGLCLASGTAGILMNKICRRTCGCPTPAPVPTPPVPMLNIPALASTLPQLGTLMSLLGMQMTFCRESSWSQFIQLHHHRKHSVK